MVRDRVGPGGGGFWDQGGAEFRVGESSWCKKREGGRDGHGPASGRGEMALADWEKVIPRGFRKVWEMRPGGIGMFVGGRISRGTEFTRGAGSRHGQERQ